MKTKSILAVASALFLYQPVVGSAALSEEGLLELVEKGVSSELTIRIIECDCVDFPVDARAALRLANAVPEPVLHAAIDCYEKRTSAGARAPAPVAVAVAPVLPTAPVAAAMQPAPSQPLTPPGDPYTLPQIKSVAIIPVALDDKYSKRMTKVFRTQLKKAGTSFSLSSSFKETERPLSNEPLEVLLKAGRSVGVEAVIVGTGSTFTVGGYPAVQLGAKLIEVNQGQVVWSAEGASQGGNISWHEARTAATKSVLSKLP